MRVLLVSYYFPPSGGSGVQRPTKFAKYLPQSGWDVTVLTVDPKYASYPDLDDDMVNELPDSVDIVRTRAWDPYNIYARLLGKDKQDAIVVHMSDTDAPGWKDHLARWVRANVFVPDARVGWVRYAVKEAVELYQEEPYDVVLTTGPPHSVHLIGKRLARRIGVPWVADFRDPWTGIFYRADMPVFPLVDRYEKRLEKSVLTEADEVVVVSMKDKHDFEKLTGRTVSYIPNGYDPEDFHGAGDNRRTDSTNFERNRFVLGYVGVLDEPSNPQHLWTALGNASGALPEVSISITGRAEEGVLRQIREAGLNVISNGYLPHEDAVRAMHDCSLLFFCVYKGEENRYLVPAKLYEYLATGVPILGVGPVDGEAAKILDECGAGKMFDYRDRQGMTDYLMQHYEAWERGQPVSGAPIEHVQKYSRIALTEQLALLLDTVVEGQ